MAAESFRFKLFHVHTPGDVFPVTTDSVLLGAWADCSKVLSVLDLGTGSGMLSLMIAQRTNEDCKIYGLDIHAQSLQCAKSNFSISPWNHKLYGIHSDALDLLAPAMNPLSNQTFDLIICNPPYFQDQLLSEDQNVSRAKHQSYFDYSKLAEIAASLLSEIGILAVVLPYHLEFKLTSVCLRNGLALKRICKVQHRLNMECNLCLCEYSKAQDSPEITTLVLYDENNQRTTGYAALTKDYYL